MSDPQFAIERVQPWDLLTLTRMAYANMTGVDREFTRSTSGPIAHALGYFILPLYLLTSGRGYKATVDREIVGCAFLHIRRLSGFVYNVNVNKPFRRMGIGRALMEHLEREVRRFGRRWVGLHVDDGNDPARNLYESLDYRAYHYKFLRTERPVQLPAMEDGVQARPLLRYEGLRIWKSYLDLARREGDPWAARLMREDFDEGPPPGGVYYALHFNATEVGCGWAGGRSSWPIVYLLLRSEYWDRRDLTLTYLGQIAKLEENRVDAIDLHLGSSEHLRTIYPTLREDGFTRCNRPRILMLKELAI